MSKKVLITGAIAIVLVLITAISGTFIYLRTSQRANKEVEKPFDSKKLAESAAARYKELTGFTYEEAKELQEKAAPLKQAIDSGATLTPIQQAEADRIQSEIKSRIENSGKKRINYTKTEYKVYDYKYFSENVYFTNFSFMPGFDKESSFIHEEWTVACSSKMITRQGDHIFTVDLENENFIYSYMSGSYAIKLTEKNPIACSESAFPESGELDYLKYMIYDFNDTKVSGTTNINGKKVFILDYEIKSPETDQLKISYKHRFFIDYENYNLVRTQGYYNDDFKYQTTILESSSTLGTNFDEINSYNEVQGIPIKEFDKEKALSLSNGTNTLEEILALSNIFLAEDDAFKESSIFNTATSYISASFDPEYNPTVIGQYGGVIDTMKKQIASYTTQKLFGQVFKSNTKLEEVYPYNSKIITDITVSVDSIQTKAKLITDKTSYETSDGLLTGKELVITDSKGNMHILESNQDYQDISKMKFKTLK